MPNNCALYVLSIVSWYENYLLRIMIIIYSLRGFHISVSWWFFTGGLSDSKSPQVSRTLLSILAVLHNAIIWIVSTHLPTSKSSRPSNNHFVTVPRAPITIGTIVTFMFHSFFNSLARSRYLSFFSHSFSFILWSAGTAKSTILQILFFFLYVIIKSSLLAGIRWYMYMSKSHRSLCVSFFPRRGTGLCIYHLLGWSNLNFLYISQWITLPTQSCLVLYSFCANLLHSLIMCHSCTRTAVILSKAQMGRCGGPYLSQGY